MRLEYFANGCQDCPLILIYGAEETRALSLSQALSQIATGAANFVDVQVMANFDTVNGCNLRIQNSKHEANGVQMTEENSFIWALTADECEDKIGLLEPFSKRTDDDTAKHRHQFMELNGEIKVIFSTDRQW